MTKQVEKQVFDSEIRQQLERILRSPLFAQSDRLSRFLRYTVEHVIAGQEESLKEYVIGTEVYDRRPPYHPSQDSIVRTEARRLRSKLKEYYEVEGHDDPIFIFFRPGSYVPVFRTKDSTVDSQIVADTALTDLNVSGTGVPVAVLPFLDLSGQPLSSRYAMGVTDELIHELMQCEGCRVISAASVAHLAGQQPDVPGLAQKLGVQIVFEGTVREEGNRVRVTGRIVNADGFQLWSQRLDAEADSSKLFDMQEEFASALVSRVRPQQSVILAAKATASPLLLSVYPTLLKGESLLEEGTISDVQGALAKFREVAQATPRYARAFCGIVRCHTWMALHGAVRSLEHVSQARSTAEMAMKLDPQMADVFTSQGSVHSLEWQWEEAEESFRKAVEHRSHAAGNRQFAMLLTLLGRFDEACFYLKIARRIDPFSNLQKAADAKFYYLSRRHEEAIEHFSEPMRYGPVPVDAQVSLALIHASLGKYEIATHLAQQIQRCTGGDAPLLSRIAEVYAHCQNHTAAANMAEKFGLLSENAPMSKFRQARLALALGDQDMAKSLLFSSYADKDAELPYFATEPCFDPMRQQPEFSELLGKIRVADRA